MSAVGFKAEDFSTERLWPRYYIDKSHVIDIFYLLSVRCVFVVYVIVVIARLSY